MLLPRTIVVFAVLLGCADSRCPRGAVDIQGLCVEADAGHHADSGASDAAQPNKHAAVDSSTPADAMTAQDAGARA